METDSNELNINSAANISGILCISIHPLVIMNISDHWTRALAQGTSAAIFGAIIGKQNGRSLEITNSFELVSHMISEDIILDKEYYDTKEEQFKQVFCETEFLGWYRAGESSLVSDIAIHKQICQINENPIFIKLTSLSSTSKLPLFVYESVIDLLDGEAHLRFVELPFTLTTEEAERIGIDHVAHMSTSQSAEISSINQQFKSQINASQMLLFHIRFICDYLNAVRDGLAPMNEQILQDIDSLMHRLPATQSDAFLEHLCKQSNDVLMIANLGAMTKLCNSLNQLITKFNITNDKQSFGRRLRAGNVF